MPEFRYRARNRVCLAAAVPAIGCGGTAGIKPESGAASESNRGGDRAAGAGVAAGAHAVGTTEVETSVGARPSGTEMAGGEHDRGAAEAGRFGGSAQEAAEDGAVHRTAGACRRAEPGVVRGLQGLVSHRGWRAHRSAYDQRRAQPLSAALPGGGEDGHGASAGDLRSGVSAVWIAAS